jgi:protein-S-isoprenylcysteine O-methyltransferase Ste14
MMNSPLPLLVVVGAIAILGATGNLFSSSPIAIALQVGAIALSAWARRTFRPGTFRVTAAPANSAVMRDGPYRFIRHPMYAAALLFIWTAVLWHLSAFTLVLGAVVTAVVFVRIQTEERLLRSQLPGFEEYSRTTNAVIPFVL